MTPYRLSPARHQPHPFDPEVFRVAFDHAPLAVGVCDGDGRFVSANAALGRLLDRAPESLVGRPFLTFVHPDARAATLARYFQSVVVAAGGAVWRPESHDMPCIAADGSMVWVSVTWTVTAPDRVGDQYAVIHLADITERRRAAREVAEVNQRFELAFQCSPIGFAIVDLRGHLLQANPALQDMLGYSVQELQERTFLEITHPDDRAASAEVFHRLLAGQVDHDTGIKRYRTRAGQTVYARRSAAILRDGSAPRYLLLQIENITGEHEARAALRERAIRDALTGLATRESLAEELALIAAPRSLVVVGLQNLPRLNGALGRDGSNEILRTVARRLSTSCRPEDRIARVGSTQFAILVNDHPTAAATVARRIAAALATPVAVGQRHLIVDARVATVDDPCGRKDLDSLLQCGDLANTSGLTTSGSWTQFSPAMLAVSTREVNIESELRLALVSGGLSVAYQPIVDLAAGATRAFEVLSRWHHDTLGVVSPSEFIPAAERSGLIHEFTIWTLTTACADLATWIAETPEARHLAIAINVAPQCLTEPRFAASVRDILAASGLLGRQLILEITEASLAHDCDSILDTLRDLRQAGIGISIDDFGTGQSSLSRIARYPVTEVKLDLSFIADVREPGDEAPLIQAAIAMAAALNLSVTVEGVETSTQLDLLRSYGCPHAQGFLLGRPQSAAATREDLRSPAKTSTPAPRVLAPGRPRLATHDRLDRPDGCRE